MKKVYFLGLALMFAGAQSFAQRSNSTYTFGYKVIGNELERIEPARTHSASNGGDRALNIVWTEDFNGASGMTTANGAWTTEGTNAAYWTINSSHPLSSFGWTDGLDAQHLTWDSYNPNASEPGGFATTIVNGAVYSPTMDLSGAVNGAIVEYQLETMFCCNYQEFPWYLYVSTDDGVTWSSAIPIDYGVDRNIATEDIAKPMTHSIDISAYLDPTPANNTNCRIKFSWEASNADPNGQINTHYFWMIDNITIFEIPPYEVQQQRLWLDDIAASWEYGDIPTSQMIPLTVQSKVKSIGSGVPSNFAQEVTVYNGSMTQIHQETGGTLANAPLSQGETDTITFTTSLDLNTLANDTYSVRVVTIYDEADEVPTNDTLWRTFNITDNVISHIDYDQPMGRNYSSNTDRTETGAFFPIYNDVELHGVNWYLRQGTTTNPASTDIEVEMIIYQDNGSTIDYLDGPWTFDITNSMLDQWNTFNLHQAKYESYNTMTLTAGNVYVIVMNVYGGDIVWYRNNPIDEDNSGIFWHDGDATWYLTGDEPWIQLNFDNALNIDGTDNQNFSIGQNYPNPVNGTSTITYQLQEASNVSVTFTDLSGKVVKTVNQGNQAAGTYQLTIDGSDFAEGVYFYTFTIGDVQVTKKMTVTK